MIGLRKARLSAVALGVALGLMCGIWMLVVGIMATQGVFGAELVARWGTFFPGIDATIKGSLIAGGWGFIKGFFSGFILAGLYNLCLCCCTRGHCSCCKSSCTACACKCNDVEKNKVV